MDVAFLDIEMADLNGIDLAKRLKQHCRSLNIIFATAYNDYYREAMALHASGYLLKPMKRKNLAVLLICLGLCSCVSGAMLWQGNNAESEEAGEAAERVFVQLAAEISAAAETGEHAGSYFAPYYAPLMEAVPEMPTAVVEDSIWLGQIEIPALGISLPVLSEYTESGLRSAPCRYSGSCYTNDIVICAHNYASFFDKLTREGDPSGSPSRVFSQRNGPFILNSHKKIEKCSEWELRQTRRRTQMGWRPSRTTTQYGTIPAGTD